MTTHEPRHESKAMRRAAAKLSSRIHGGKHTEGRACVCKTWDRAKGLTKPGSLKVR